tara:strand:- start:71 stop:460 length:390 start_codon:yes stop_codon:yes gene_type:complete
MAYKQKPWSGYQNSPVKQSKDRLADAKAKSIELDNYKKQREYNKAKQVQEAKDDAANARALSPLLQKYWYKVDGKKTDKAGYLAAHKKGIHDPSSPNFTDGSGLQTNHPDIHGYKAARKKAWEKSKTKK